MKSLVYKNGYQIKEDICLFCPDLIKMDNEIRTWTRSGTSDHYYDWTEDWVGVEYHPIEPFYEFSITSSKEDREKILNHIDSSYDEFLRSKNSDLKNILYKKISLQKPVQKIDFSQHTEGIVNNLLKFYYASELGKGSPDYDGGPGCGSNNIGQDEYEIGSLVEEQNQIIESKIFSLIGLYESGGLKTTLGISEENDFVFAFEFANGTKIEPANVVIPDTNIYATTFPVQYLDVDANLKIGYLTIKVW